MATMIPSVFDTENGVPGEREVFSRLKDDPNTSDWIVLHSLDIASHSTQVSGEIDFVVIIPHKGVVCLEIKSHRQVRRSADGFWYWGSNAKPDLRGPFKQASTAMHSLRKILITERPDLSNVPFWSAVIFPYASFNVTSPEWHQWQVIDSSIFWSRPLSNLVLNVINNARALLSKTETAKWFHPASKTPYHEQCQDILEVIRPSFELFSDKRIDVKIKEHEMKKYTEEQFQALDAMATNKRVLFKGPAGTGKTFLAMEAARRSALEGQKTLFLCYNRFLAIWISNKLNMHANIDVMTIHQYMLNITGEYVNSNKDNSSFWETELPNQTVLKMFENDQLIGKYDQIIVDEAQDIFNELYLDILDLSLGGGLGSGCWRLFGDFQNQTIYDKGNITLTEFREKRKYEFSEYALGVNCRNTPKIATMAEVIGNINPKYTRIRREDDGVQPDFKFHENSEHLVDVLEQALSECLNEGYKEEEIVVLSLLQASCAERLACKDKWIERIVKFDPLQRSTGKIRFSTIHSFKGLEASVIILADLEGKIDEYLQSLLYIGITRALHKLTILVPVQQKESFVNIVLKSKWD